MLFRSPNSLPGVHRRIGDCRTLWLWLSSRTGRWHGPIPVLAQNEPVMMLPCGPVSGMTSPKHRYSNPSYRFSLSKEHIRFSDLIFTENVDAGPAQMCGGHTGGRDLGSGKSPVKNDVRSARRTAFL